jgi:hypothetical protein
VGYLAVSAARSGKTNTSETKEIKIVIVDFMRSSAKLVAFAGRTNDQFEIDLETIWNLVTLKMGCQANFAWHWGIVVVKLF